MFENASPALEEYIPAFNDPDIPLIYYYTFKDDKSVHIKQMSRGEFWSLARRAAAMIAKSGCKKGDVFTLCFSANRLADIAVRLAAAMTGTVPVTVNWQGDTVDRVLYKIRSTLSRLVITDSGFNPDFISQIKSEFPDIPVIDICELESFSEYPESEFAADVDTGFTRIIIFTSGTTGMPKGVQLSYRAYMTNMAALEHLLEIEPGDKFSVLIVNPLHHANSSAITDWALRRPGSEIHLVEHYSTEYWEILHSAVEMGYDRIVAPVVSRHFDFLENLVVENRLPVDLDILKSCMAEVDFLIGSAPVGPTTIERLLKYTGSIPYVRFGSTETCLQVMGIPGRLSEEQKLAAFRRGWSHEFSGEPAAGYYIGRPHPPYTFARIVRSITRGAEGFMSDSLPGEPGYFITRGDNLMTGYIGNRDATKDAFHDGWYLGMKDICFFLESKDDGEVDYYWMSRESSLMIRGGANYACDQINEELAEFASARYKLPKDSFDIAVVGLKVDSEHEDSCCVTLELRDESIKGKESLITGTFISEAGKSVTKGAKPDYIRIAPIPRNFKGTILVPDLRREFQSWLDREKAHS